MEWVLNLKDFIMIIGGIVSLVAAYYSLKKEIDDAKSKIKNMQTIVEKLEQEIYDQLDEVKNNQVKNSDMLITKIDNLNRDLISLTKHFAELTGFLKGKDIK